MAEAFTADRRLYLSRDKARVVEEHDPDAGHLFAIPGDVIDAETAKSYGLKARRAAKADDAEENEPKRSRAAEKAADEADEKAAPKSENKARAKSEDKGAAE